mmetsp:Transcript_5483/g.12528  ORF Transcript_5483/g.12528 Transcript_5483/m.12528 type:complete len:522 (-) Transcript_5483:410-1975(-)
MWMQFIICKKNNKNVNKKLIFSYYLNAAKMDLGKVSQRLDSLATAADMVDERKQLVALHFEEAGRGRAESMVWLGKVFLGGLFGQKRDYSTAYSWLERAARHGRSDAVSIMQDRGYRFVASTGRFISTGVGRIVHDVSKVVTSSDAFKHLGETEENERKRKRPEHSRNEESVNTTDPLFASYLARLRQDVQQQGEAHPGVDEQIGGGHAHTEGSHFNMDLFSEAIVAHTTAVAQLFTSCSKRDIAKAKESIAFLMEQLPRAEKVCNNTEVATQLLKSVKKKEEGGDVDTKERTTLLSDINAPGLSPNHVHTQVKRCLRTVAQNDLIQLKAKVESVQRESEKLRQANELRQEELAEVSVKENMRAIQKAELDRVRQLTLATLPHLLSMSQKCRVDFLTLPKREFLEYAGVELDEGVYIELNASLDMLKVLSESCSSASLLSYLIDGRHTAEGEGGEGVGGEGGGNFSVHGLSGEDPAFLRKLRTFQVCEYCSWSSAFRDGWKYLAGRLDQLREEVMGDGGEQ